MTYLADACALIAFLTNPNPERDMTQAAPIMERGDVSVLSTTVWEITRKVSIGKLPEFWSPLPSLGALLRAQRYRPHALDWLDAERANALPALHRDPMDRLLIAVALRTAMTVITSDRMFRNYDVATVW